MQKVMIQEIYGILVQLLISFCAKCASVVSVLVFVQSEKTRVRIGKYFAKYFSRELPSDTMSFNFRPFEMRRVPYTKIKAKRPRSSNGEEEESVVPYPLPRSGHRIVCNDSVIYAFGGFNPNTLTGWQTDWARSTLLYQELWKFDIIRRQWTLLMGPDDNLPAEVASHAMILQGDALMIYGGTGYPFGQSCSNKLFVLRPNVEPIDVDRIEGDPMLPVPQYGQAIVCHGRFLYVIGGTTGFDYSCDIYRLDLQNKKWECLYVCRDELRNDPPGRYRHEIAYDGEFIYIFGGGTSNVAYDLIDIPAYELETNTWHFKRTLPDRGAPEPGYPFPRKCHSCVQYETEGGVEVVIAGGCGEANHYEDIWKLNLRTLQWRLFITAKLPFPLFFHDAAASKDGCMYIFGGIKIRNSSTTRINEIYKMWVTIPKLSAICWEAILSYYPKIDGMTSDRLLQLGVPPKYANRI